MDDVDVEVVNPSIDWYKMHDKYYRKELRFQMGWKHVDLAQIFEGKVMGAVAPNGGPIAMIRDDTKKMLRAATGSTSKPSLRIFTSSGVLLSEFVVEDQDGLKPIKLGWTYKEELVCVKEDGSVSMYSIHGDYLRTFSMGKEVQLNGIQEIRIWATGMVVLMCNRQLVAVSDFDRPMPTLLAPVDCKDDITAMVVLEQQSRDSGGVEVLLATSGGTVIAVNQSEAVDQLLQQGPFKMMAVSPNGKLLAGFTVDGKLRVMLTNFTKNLSEVDFRTTTSPRQVVWSGTDAVVVYWASQDDNVLLLVGPYEDNIRFDYDEPVMLVPEMDGIRILTNDKCEFLQLVPKSLEEIFRVGSNADAAILFDAWCQFNAHSSKADENIRSIAPTLADAVDVCIQAAGNASEILLQKQLLKAASFGKSCCDWSLDTDSFVDMCKDLRVLNMLRTPEIGRPLTYKQYEALTHETVVALLMNQHHHLAALNICKYLKLGAELEKTVLVHWACAKIRAYDPSTVSEEQFVNSLISKLQTVSGVPYCDVAATAYEYRHEILAAEILAHEPRVHHQIPLLIDWGRDLEALNKAIAYGSSDLAYLALLHMKDTMHEDQFFPALANQTTAGNLLVAYCKEMDLKFLQSYLYLNNRFEEAGHVLILEGYKKEELRDRISALTTAMKFFEKSKDHAFSFKSTQDELKLLSFQVKLTEETNKPFVDMSLSDTIFYCFEFNKTKIANELVKEFKVPEKRFWWLKVKALAHFGQFEALREFANSKKSPIGYMPFFEVCMEQNRPKDAELFIAKLTDNASKVEAYIQLKKFAHAADVATTSKDPALIERVEIAKAISQRTSTAS